MFFPTPPGRSLTQNIAHVYCPVNLCSFVRLREGLIGKGRALSNSFGSPVYRFSGDALLDHCCGDTLAGMGSVRKNRSSPDGFLGQRQ